MVKKSSLFDRSDLNHITLQAGGLNRLWLNDGGRIGVLWK